MNNAPIIFAFLMTACAADADMPEPNTKLGPASAEPQPATLPTDVDAAQSQPATFDDASDEPAEAVVCFEPGVWRIPSAEARDRYFRFDVAHDGGADCASGDYPGEGDEASCTLEARVGCLFDLTEFIIDWSGAAEMRIGPCEIEFTSPTIGTALCAQNKYRTDMVWIGLEFPDAIGS